MKIVEPDMQQNNHNLAIPSSCSRMKKVAPSPPHPIDEIVSVHRKSFPLSQPMSNRSSIAVAGEDCAIDERLEGRMNLLVVFPDNRKERINIDRRTPMLDLLVHATTTNKISPSGHLIKVLSDGKDVLYKPNTPVGSLDVTTVYIVPKVAAEIPVKKMPRLPNQPFEQQTFRLQVNLPRNQRMVLRVSPRTTLLEIKQIICHEKELDYGSHHLVHPAQPDSVLDLNSTLDDYGCAEISILSNTGLRDSIRNCSANFIAYPRSEDERKKKGILRLFSRRKKETFSDVGVNGLNGQSTARAVTTRENTQPKQQQQSTKRKPAPAPPTPMHSAKPEAPLIIQSPGSINSRPESEVSAKTDELGSTVSHSRHSSDSSGYHEPSVFSDCSENKSPEASIVHSGNVLSGPENISDKCGCEPMTHQTNFRSASSSSSGTSGATRKRKAPLPPAPVLREIDAPSSCADLPDSVSVDSATKVSPSRDSIKRCQGSTSVNDRQSLVEDGNCQVSEHFTKNIAHIASNENVENNSEICNEIIPAVQCLLLSEHQIAVESGGTGQTNLDNSSREEEMEMEVSVKNLHAECSPENSDLLETETCESVSTACDHHIEPSSLVCSEGRERIDEEANETVKAPEHSLQPFSISNNLEPVTNNEKQNVPSPQEVDNVLLNVGGGCEPSSECCEEQESNKTHVICEPLFMSLSQQRLVNFAMGCYKSEEKDIYSEENPEYVLCSKTAPDAEFVITKPNKRVLHSKLKGQTPSVKIVPFEERDSLESVGVKGQVRQRCAELSLINSLPLTGRSASLHNLVPDRMCAAVKLAPSESSIASVKNSNAVKACTEETIKESDFNQEQDHLKKEYLKLQAQFVSWQKQLLSNQYLLMQSDADVKKASAPRSGNKFQNEAQNMPAGLHKFSSEKVVESATPLHSKSCYECPLVKVEGKSKKTGACENEESKMAMEDSEQVSNGAREATAGLDIVGKSQTLPRLVTQNTSAFATPQTMTLNRRVRPKSQLISVTIGSWMQRNEVISDIDSSAVASSRSKFQSLENIPLEHKKTNSEVAKRSASHVPSSKRQSITSDDDDEAMLHSSVASGNAILSERGAEKKSKAVARLNQELKSTNVEKKATLLLENNNRPSKILVPVLSMKDDVQPPPLQTLKKWPLSDIKGDAFKASEKRSVWEDIKATAKWSPWEPRDRVTRAEVDLRKQRAEKLQTSKRKEYVDKNKGGLVGSTVTEVDVHIVDETKFQNVNTVESESKVDISQKETSELFSKELEQMLLRRRISENGALEEPAYAEAKDSKEQKREPANTVQAIPEPPPPPPPVSTMPTIPPAIPIPKSSQLLINSKERIAAKSTKSAEQQSVPRKDPREELMLEIRGFAGRQALRKVPSKPANWNMKFYGSLSTVNS